MTMNENSETRIAYADQGAGDPVLLIHCSAASRSEWRSLSDVLGREFRAIATDQWGCGESPSWSGRNAFTLADEAAPIVDIMERVGRPMHLVGHSYGGGVALRVARERRALTRSLTLIEPSCFHLLRNGGDKDEAFFAEIAKVAAGVSESISNGDLWGGMAKFVDYWDHAGAWDEMPYNSRIKLCQRLHKVSLDFHALFEEQANLETYAALDVSTLILCGQHSPGPSRRIVEMLTEIMPRAKLSQVPGAGHMSPLTHPGVINDQILNHLRTLSNGEKIPVQRRRAA